MSFIKRPENTRKSYRITLISTEAELLDAKEFGCVAYQGYTVQCKIPEFCTFFRWEFPLISQDSW